MFILKYRLAYFTGALICALGLAACGGGSGSSTPDGSTGSGTVAVLMTDAPSDEFEQINLTIRSVELLGDGAPITLYEGDRRVNLLDLTNHNELLGAVDVPAGEYSKIRLRIEDVALHPEAGAPVPVKTTGNGKLDLNPRQPFTVNGGELLVIQLDMDANKSIKLTATGNGNGNGAENYILRPVVFVDVLNEAVTGRLVRLQGEVTEVDASAGTLELCDIEFAFLDMGGFLGGGDESCIDVVTGEETAVFGSDGQPIVLGDVVSGSTVAVLGRFDAEQGDDLAFNALVLEVPAQAYSRFAGVVSGVEALDLRFSLVDGDDAYQVEALSDTLLLNVEGEPVQWGDVNNGDEVAVEAVENAAVLSPAVIFVKPGDDEAYVEGVVGSITLEDNTFDVDSGDLVVCIVVTPETDVLLIGEQDEGDTTTELTLDELSGGAEVEVFGEERVDSCIVAETVLIVS